MVALRHGLLMSCAALLLGNAPLAIAQEATDLPPLRKKTITDPYAATGLSAGGLRLFPSLEIGTGITSNVRGSATNPKADIALELKPTLRFESDWARHQWTGSSTIDVVRYAKENDLSTLSGKAETAFRLDIRRTTKADFTASYNLSETGVASTQLPNTAIGPRRDHNFNAGVAFTHDFGGLEGSIKTALARGIYEDVDLTGGGTEDNSDRNYWAPTLTLRTALIDAGAPVKPFAEISYQPRIHDTEKDRNNLKRDSQGFAGSVGLTLNRGPIWEGEVALTYLLRRYADPSLETSQALGAITRLVWRPTDLTSFEGTTGVGLDETATAGISATRSWTASLNMTHALRENLDLKAGLGFTLQDTGTEFDKSNTATLGLDWQMNPNMTAGITYQGLWVNSGASGGDYNDQRVMTSIILKR